MQAIYALAREVDPKGERTIGVLTKVDTIETGTHEKWFNYLRGGGYKLKLVRCLIHSLQTCRQRTCTHDPAYCSTRQLASCNL